MRSTLFFLLGILPAVLFSQAIPEDWMQSLPVRNIGPAGMSGRVTAISVVPGQTENIYIGTAAGGIWQSENAGMSWTPIFEKEKRASIGDISIFEPNPSLIYVGTGEGNPRNSQNSGWGMYKSLDGGQNWEHLGLEHTRQIHRVLVHPTNPDVVWVGASGETWGDSEHRGVYKTEDGGSSWKKVLYVDERTGCSDLVIHPTNPNLLLAGMWSHRREPDFFTSGGAGSALYLSSDGGESWEKVSTEAGIPSGELGRIGLAFAPSQPDWVYAYIESKENAVYRSTDGGKNWQRRSLPGQNNIGGRPFYYAELYVDVANENRVYSIATEVTVSEDGGKSWEVFVPGDRVHTDHHAWWANPEDPKHLLLGSDGGFHSTRDRGKTWDFSDHLPIAQFYHLRVDNEIPYNVYGGLQDNGSWVGPSQTWFKGNIRNFYWQRLSVGDGFDVVPDPKDADFGYAMGQSGNLVRYHRSSGQLLHIKPTHPEGEYLRFNWNAGIAIDPHDEQTIYYGSQYLHKSEDHGQSWEIISPDLTTNDTSKQHFLESGGLSYDVTGAEFHTTIIAIAPSPLEEGLIWVGTDDGNLQLTRNGGESWTLLTPNIKGVPAGTWIPHIKASNHDPAEVFVVFEDHRRGNWEPFVFRSQDYGQSWDRIVGPDDVGSYVYCFEQDPEVSQLYFCGTDEGLYLSIDAGNNWQRWQGDFPTVPVSDLVVHPREGDLVVATFGRSFWILDDLQPLRFQAQLKAGQGRMQPLHLFAPPTAYLGVIGESIGYRKGKVGEALYEGENRPYGALITYQLAESLLTEETDAKELSLDQQVHIHIQHASGKVVRHLYRTPKAGLNRFAWDLRQDGVRPLSVPKPNPPTAPAPGFLVAPGTYQVVLSYQGRSVKQSLTVQADPRIRWTQEQYDEKAEFLTEFTERSEEMLAAADQLRKVEAGMSRVSSRLKEAPDSVLTEALEPLMKELKNMKEQMLGKKAQGIYRNPTTLQTQWFQTMMLVDDAHAPLSSNHQTQLKQLSQSWSSWKAQWEEWLETDLAKFQQLMESQELKWW